MNTSLTTIKKIFLSAVIMAVCSCSQRQHYPVDSTEIDELDILADSTMLKIPIGGKLTVLNVNDVIDSMTYIKLQNTNESVVGQISKIVLANQQIYIHDRSANQIKVFGMNGEYRYSINDVGKGPNMYNRIHDFLIKGDSTLIYDNLSRKILVYNKEGEFLKTVKTKFNFKEFISINNELFVFALRNNDNAGFPSLDGYSVAIGTLDSIIHKGFKNNRLLTEWEMTVNNTLINVEGDVRFSPFLSNYIYGINGKGEFYQKYHLEYDNALPMDYYKETDEKGFEKYVKRNKYVYFNSFIRENSSHIYLRFNPPSQNYYYGLVNKKSMHTVYFDGYTNAGDFLGYNHPMTVYNDKFVSVLQPYDILQSNKIEKVTQKIGNISKTDNPIVILYTYK